MKDEVELTGPGGFQLDVMQNETMKLRGCMNNLQCVVLQSHIGIFYMQTWLAYPLTI